MDYVFLLRKIIKIGYKYRNIVEKYRNNEHLLHFFLKIVVRTQFY